jgi:hypothetical protein
MHNQFGSICKLNEQGGSKKDRQLCEECVRTLIGRLHARSLYQLLVSRKCLHENLRNSGVKSVYSRDRVCHVGYITEGKSFVIINL